MTEAQRRLAAANARWAAGVARTFTGRLPAHADRDAVMGAALEGLCQAAVSWRPGCGPSFRSWARLRVVGAMRDQCRRLDWASRPDRAAGVVPVVVSLETEEPDGDGTLLPLHETVASPFDPADGWAGRADVSAAVAALPYRERVVVLARLVGVPAAAVASWWGLSEGRVSQLGASAERDLRRRLAA